MSTCWHDISNEYMSTWMFFIQACERPSRWSPPVLWRRFEDGLASICVLNHSCKTTKDSETTGLNDGVIINWRWWMWMITAYQWTYSPSCYAWSKGWQPPGAQSAFIKWTGWTLAMALNHDDSTINIVICVIIINLYSFMWSDKLWRNIFYKHGKASKRQIWQRNVAHKAAMLRTRFHQRGQRARCRVARTAIRHSRQ